MNIKKPFLASLALAACLLPASAQDAESAGVNLRASLSSAKNTADSLSILYDIFDLSTKKGKIEPGWQIMAIGERLGDDEILGDIIPQLAVVQMRDTAVMTQLAQKADLIQDSIRRKGVRLFVDVTRSSVEASYIAEADRHDALIKYAQADMTPAGDIYGDILDLYRMVIFLGQHSKGNFYLEYMDRLDKLISQLPEKNRYIRNLFYTTAANSHTNVGNHAKGVEADRNLLAIIGQLRDKYTKMGRKYRNYDRYDYLSYRRMLRNYKALTPEEVKEYYAKTAMIAERDAECGADFNLYGRPTIYRMMATKDYHGLIPRIQKALKQPNIESPIKRELLGMLVEVADSLNDNAALLPALKEYNHMLADRLDQNSEEAYRELQMRYEVNQLRNEKVALEMEKLDAEIATRQKLIVVALAAVLCLAVFIMFLYRNIFRLRQRTRELRDENVRMHNQIDEITTDGFPADTRDPRTL